MVFRLETVAIYRILFTGLSALTPPNLTKVSINITDKVKQFAGIGNVVHMVNRLNRSQYRVHRKLYFSVLMFQEALIFNSGIRLILILGPGNSTHSFVGI